MNRYFKAHNDVPAHPNISKTTIIYDSNETYETPAQKYLKVNTREYYQSSLFQTSVYPLNLEETYEHILNDRGLQVYKQAQQNVNDKKFDSEFIDFAIQFSNSGGWFADEKSDFYDPDEQQGYINSFKDVTILGLRESDRQYITTSPCIFYNLKEKWCLTQSGSLYKLNNEMSHLDMLTQIHKNKINKK